jgi:uncharacterized membrane-anchored protein
MPTAVTEWSHAMMTSLAAAMAMFLSAIPKIIGFAVILAVGWLLSSLVEKGVAALLRAVRFNDLAEKSGFAGFVNKMNGGAATATAGGGGSNRGSTPTDAAGMIGLIVKWFVRLIAAVVAFDALGLPAVSEVLREFLMWLPNLIVALVVLVIGGLAARALSNLVRGAASEAGLSNPNLLSKVASTLVWAFAVIVAVNQIGIASELVNTLFIAFVGAIALGLGLAFGLGGRETAGEILRKWYGSAQENSGKLKQAAEAGGQIAASKVGGMQGGGSGSMGGGGGAMGGSSTGGGYPGGSTGGGYTGGGSASPVSRGGAGSPQDNQMYPTPSSPRHPSEGGT